MGISTKQTNTNTMGMGKVRKMLMEALGVFSLCYIGGMSIMAASLNSDGGPGASARGPPMAHALALGIFIWVGAHTCGSNFNPAVTVALVLTKNLKPKKLGWYLGGQILGSLLAAGLLAVMLPSKNFLKDKNGKGEDYAGTYPGFKGGDWRNYLGAFTLEFFATFFLVFMVFGTAVDKKATPYVFGLAIGGTVYMSATSLWTGAALNPCRWLGPYIVNIFFGQFTAGSLVAGLVVYVAAPILGGSTAAMVYNAMFIGD